MANENENKLYMLLGEMSSDIKNILSSLSDQDNRLNNHSIRLGKVEEFQWKLMGGATAISIAIGLLSKLM